MNGASERATDGLGPPRRIRSFVRRFAVVGVVAAAAAVAGCGVDREQARKCRQLIAAFEGTAKAIEIVDLRGDADGPDSIVIRYQAAAQAAGATPHWISCRFAGDAFAAGRLAIVSVATDRRGRLSPIELQMLLLWQRLSPGAGGVRPVAVGPAPADPLYLLQQIVNAVPGCAIYALIAVGFSLVYGIIGRINLAFGEMAAVGGHVAFLAFVVLSAWGGGGLGLHLTAALAAAVISGVCGWVTRRTIFPRWAEGETQAALIATLGLAIFLREFLRLSQGTRDRWLHPFATEPLILAADGPISVSISSGQILIAAVAAATCAGVVLLTRRGTVGRAYRACRDDIGMAALLGFDTRRIVALAFTAGAASAGVAGAIIAFYYGTVSAYMGTLIGFKALVAAVVGGLGSIRGAIVGGVAVGLLETLWSGYFQGEYRDVMVFALLAAVLVFRPEGLLGAPPARRDR